MFHIQSLSVLAALFVSSPLWASDSWDHCSSANGLVRLEWGTLSVEGVGEIAEESVRVTRVATVRSEFEKCKLKGSGAEVIALDNTVTVEEVVFTVEENEAPIKALVLCERGGSGIPANDECR